MPELSIDPIEPIPDHDQPTLLVTYTCVWPGCGKQFEREQLPGYLPRYCDEHKKAAAKERVKRWRERHPEEARQAQRDYRHKRAQQQDQDLR